jgi:hypothetical protein
MRLADLAIKRPVFVTSLVIVILVMGIMSIAKLPVDMFTKHYFSGRNSYDNLSWRRTCRSRNARIESLRGRNFNCDRDQAS